jgi:iron complex transport system substrate-binding protein
VWITNQRSVEEIFATLMQLAALVGEGEQAAHWMSGVRSRHEGLRSAAAAWPRRPRVFFEEWDEPLISAIRWVSELIGIAGGEDVFPELALQRMGRGRVIADPLEPVRRGPDLIVGSWCGKKFRPERVAARPGWQAVPAVCDAELHEIKSCDILQPGPAALTDGVEQLHRLFDAWARRQAGADATNGGADD